jgi:hypothetical protein
MDNHADTTCFGRILWRSNLQASIVKCRLSVTNMTTWLTSQLPVASAATAWDDPETGETTILLFHQGLWFGDDLTNSLINPNQCRSHGIDICDDPFDPNRTIRIVDTLTDLTIPMEFGRSFVYFQSRAPTMEEIRDNPHIEMTSDFPWDPATVGQHPLSRKEEERRKIVAKVQIDQHTISARPDEPQLHYDESEYDLLMSSCSAAYSERTLIQRLISSIRVASCHEEDEDLEDETDVPQRTVASEDI